MSWWILVALTAGLLAAVVFVPEWLAFRLPIRDRLERAKRADEYRRTLVQLVGGLAVAATLYFTSQQLETSREAQLTDRLGRAVEHVGSTDTVKMVGGIVELDRVARESPTDRAAIVQLLAAFLRTRTPVQDTAGYEGHSRRLNRPRPEIAAALAVLGRWAGRRSGPEPLHVDLSKTELVAVELANADLRGAVLSGAHVSGDLGGAILDSATLEGTLLYDFVLDSSSLVHARLDGAALCFGSMRHARLDSAAMESSQWSSVNVDAAGFTGVDGQWADLHDLDVDLTAIGRGRFGRDSNAWFRTDQLRTFGKTRGIRVPDRLSGLAQQLGGAIGESPTPATKRCGGA